MQLCTKAYEIILGAGLNELAKLIERVTIVFIVQRYTIYLLVGLTFLKIGMVASAPNTRGDRQSLAANRKWEGLDHRVD